MTGYTGRIPKGIRNHNPGNLKAFSEQDWRGQTGKDEDGFCIFDDAEYGIRAMGITLLNMAKLHGIDAPKDIVAHYSPDSEMIQADYVKEICVALHCAPDTPVLDKLVLFPLVIAMITFENGECPYRYETLYLGVKCAIQHTR